MTLYDIKSRIVPILMRQEVQKAALFGSYARNEAGKDSDIDILVKMGRGKTLLDLVALRLELREKLGKNVDILTYDSINPLLKARILKEQKLIYEKRA